MDSVTLKCGCMHVYILQNCRICTSHCIRRGHVPPLLNYFRTRCHPRSLEPSRALERPVSHRAIEYFTKMELDHLSGLKGFNAYIIEFNLHCCIILCLGCAVCRVVPIFNIPNALFGGGSVIRHTVPVPKVAV